MVVCNSIPEYIFNLIPVSVCGSWGSITGHDFFLSADVFTEKWSGAEVTVTTTVSEDTKESKAVSVKRITWFLCSDMFGFLSLSNVLFWGDVINRLASQYRNISWYLCKVSLTNHLLSRDANNVLVLVFFICRVALLFMTLTKHIKPFSLMVTKMLFQQLLLSLENFDGAFYYGNDQLIHWKDVSTTLGLTPLFDLDYFWQDVVVVELKEEQFID